MEATKLFDWLKVIDFPTISAHNHMVFIIQAPLLPTFFYYDYPWFLYNKKGHITWSNLSWIILLQYII